MKSLYLSFILTCGFTSAVAGTRIDNTLITASESNPNGGGYSQARVYIDQVSANTSITITKPLIVFEGFDPGIYTKPTEVEGRTSIQDFIDDVSDDAPDPATTSLEDFL